MKNEKKNLQTSGRRRQIPLERTGSSQLLPEALQRKRQDIVMYMDSFTSELSVMKNKSVDRYINISQINPISIFQ